MPKLPNFPGIDKFQGHAFHASRWDYAYTGGSPDIPHLINLEGKRVAVIGTGATAIQAVPHLAKVKTSSSSPHSHLYPIIIFDITQINHHCRRNTNIITTIIAINRITTITHHHNFFVVGKGVICVPTNTRYCNNETKSNY